MPIVRIDYEKSKLSQEEIQKVAAAIQKFAAEATGYTPAEVSVFASPNQVTVNAAPIEIYVYATFSEVSEQDMERILAKLRDQIVPFKQHNNITVPFNISVVKMNWKFELEV
ncbi:MAG: hypothetical protein AAB388_01390 [Patescibacteria group bacterium]